MCTRRADWLANESQHVESEAGEHDVHVFQALRSMDEILVANFMVFRDVLESEQYDLVVGDEAWDVDHFLHEHPQLKRAPFVWMTDFVGFLPMPDGGEREEFLTADYNAEMIEHVEGHPRVRDRSIFVGDPDDIVPDDFGPGLPSIREWTQAHYDFAGYVTGYDPSETADREALRAELGYGPGRARLRRDRWWLGRGRTPAAQGDRRLPGGEGSPAGPAHGGRHRAAARSRRVQGLGWAGGRGLRSRTAPPPGRVRRRRRARRPHDHDGAGGEQAAVPVFPDRVTTSRRTSTCGTGWSATARAAGWTTPTTDPSAIAEAIAQEAGREVRYRDVETGGAARAAALIAEVL